MRPLSLLTSFFVVFAVAVAASAAEYKVSGVHNCCGACNKRIVEALKGIDGVADINSKPNAEFLSFSAPDDATAQKAVDALGKAGFHGTVSGDKVAFKNDSQVGKGKVQRLELVGIHNCCAGCSSSIKDAIETVEGVAAHVIPAKGTSVVVEGDFDGEALVKALYAAGFHVRKQGAEDK